MTEIRRTIEQLYREDSRRILATLIRLLRDFDLAEEALHDAFLAATLEWPTSGIPRNPMTWLVSAGRFKALDRVRRRAVYDRKLEQVAAELSAVTDTSEGAEDVWPDDRLRLIFTCCHPALAPEARVALTLRTVCGLTTEEIARAYLVPASTLAQRIVRAKAKIRDAGIPYAVPEPPDIQERLEEVLQVVYLVFNEGYSPSTGGRVTRADLSHEAIRLGRLLVELTGDAEAHGLLALMLLQDARRDARTDAAGELVLLEDQDRSRWNLEQVVEGLSLVDRLVAGGELGPYGLQAAIAAEHARARASVETDWAAIVRWYDLLMSASPTPVVALNRAVAVAMAQGATDGLALIDAIVADGHLDGYLHLHVARGELLRRAGRLGEARAAYDVAWDLVANDAERRYLKRRIDELP